MTTLVYWLLDLLRRQRQDIGRGDNGNDVPHDHPWWFASLILWGGYHEVTATGRRWYGIGRVLFRPASWTHRVEIPPGRKCWTLVITGRKVRDWGFACQQGWRHHRVAEAALKRRGNVCA